MIRIIGHKGFTLVEIIITATLVTVVGLAVGSAVINGINIWQRLNKTTVEEEISVFFDKFGIDLRNTFNYKGVPFVGEQERVEFAALVSASISQPALRKAPGKVIYYFCSEEKSLNFERRNANQLYREQKGFIGQSLEGVQSCNFDYYFYDPLRKEYFWQNRWKEDRLPLALRIRLVLVRDSVIYKFTKTFNIPLGAN